MTPNPTLVPTPRRVPPLAVVAGLLTVFIVGLTANVVARDGLTTIDPDIADWAVAHRNGVLTPIAITVSNIGGTVAMTTLATLAVIAFGWFGYWRAAGLVIVTGLLSWLFVDGGKNLIARPRPPVDLHVVVKTNFAYPSGHSLGSMAIVGIVSVLLIPRLRRRAARWIAAAAAAAFVAAVGLSRIYLGVHWTTDVLGGWAIGALLVIATFSGYRYLEAREHDAVRDSAKHPSAVGDPGGAAVPVPVHPAERDVGKVDAEGQIAGGG
ncbi:phosphatase PAP2 family protein [Nocardia vulneris]|uniref:phosphatase PAP2 family protein n=1 Tax=Nocardia vulneris TaxID=1141657 RepID=UPI000AA73FC5|nr:phosphatase PAP2 family protein [Nocardia vulneris]